jgi:hypothetical protein
MRTEDKFPWWVAVPTAVVLAAALAGLRLPPVRESASAAAPPPVLTLVPAAGRETLDPSALFLSGRTGRAVVRPEVSALGGQFAPVLDAVAGPNLGRPSGAMLVPVGPTQGLGITERADAPLALGRADANFSPLSGRLAQVEAVEANTGRVRLTLTLPLVEEAGAPATGWQPLELLGTVGPTGLVAGGLVVRRGSGSADVDKYFQLRLARRERVGERLPPGVYVFRVGP